MAVSEEYKEYILDQLSMVDLVHMKNMFGGIGIFCDGKMFGMIDGGGTFRLKADNSNRPDFEAAGMEAFEHKGKKNAMPYWEVPANVVEDKKLLKEWAEKAIAI